MNWKQIAFLGSILIGTSGVAANFTTILSYFKDDQKPKPTTAVSNKLQGQNNTINSINAPITNSTINQGNTTNEDNSRNTPLNDNNHPKSGQHKQY